MRVRYLCILMLAAATIVTLPIASEAADPDFTFKVGVRWLKISPLVGSFSVQCSVCTAACGSGNGTQVGSGEASYQFPADKQFHTFEGSVTVAFSATPHQDARTARFYSCRRSGIAPNFALGQADYQGLGPDDWNPIDPSAALVREIHGELKTSGSAPTPPSPQQKK
jgi:hypothetical protein